MKNKYRVIGTTLEIYVQRQNGQVVTILCDPEDMDILSQYTWSVRKCRNHLYAVHSNSDTYMHRLLCDGSLIDHINRNPLDNRKSNLRSVTYSMNSRNVVARSNSKSGLVGIYKRKDCNRYQVFATIDKKINYLGLFKTITEAQQARNKFVMEV